MHQEEQKQTKQEKNMRAYISRGIGVKSKKWVYGYYVRHETRQICPVDDVLSDDEVMHLIVSDSFADWNMPREIQFTPVFFATIGRATGRQDANNRDIFEGDIIKHFNKASITSVVVYDGGTYQLCFKDGLCVDLKDVDSKHIEVIGDVHERGHFD